MSVINKKTCLESGGNTGYGQCFFDLDVMKGMFIVSQDFALTEDQLASVDTVVAALEAATIAAKSSRAYPLHKWVTPTNNSSDVTLQTFGNGAVRVTSEGKYDFTYQYLDGGMCLNKSLRKFNNSGGWAAYFYDNSGQLVGYKVGNTLKGIPLDLLYIPKMTPADYSNATVYAVRVSFDPVYLNDKFGIVEADDFTTWESIKGVNDVALTATREAAVITATASSGCAGTNLYDLFSDELAVVGAWVAKNKATGAAITIDSVTANADAEGWDITLDDGDADYTTGAVTLSLATAAALDALDVAKYESNVIDVVITGS